MDDAAAAVSGVPQGAMLNDFAEGICRRDMVQVARARQNVVDALGERAMSDAAAVIAAFNAYPRAADATGLPLEDEKIERTAALRAEFGFDALASRETG